jgi:hypothetical protein
LLIGQISEPEEIGICSPKRPLPLPGFPRKKIRGGRFRSFLQKQPPLFG